MQKDNLIQTLTIGYSEAQKGLLNNGNPSTSTDEIERADLLNDVFVNLLEKIKSGQITGNEFQFQNPENMTIYLKGATRKRLLSRIRQNQPEKFISFESVENDLTVNPKSDLIKTVLTAKRKNGNPLLTKTQKALFMLYYVKGLTVRETATRLNQPFKTVHRALQAVNGLIATLPLKDAIATRFYNGSNGKGFENPSFDFDVSFAPLKAYRASGQTDTKALERHKALSLATLKKHNMAATRSTLPAYYETRFQPALNGQYSSIEKPYQPKSESPKRQPACNPTITDIAFCAADRALARAEYVNHIRDYRAFRIKHGLTVDRASTLI